MSLATGYPDLDDLPGETHLEYEGIAYKLTEDNWVPDDEVRLMRDCASEGGTVMEQPYTSKTNTYHSETDPRLQRVSEYIRLTKTPRSSVYFEEGHLIKANFYATGDVDVIAAVVHECPIEKMDRVRSKRTEPQAKDPDKALRISTERSKRTLHKKVMQIQANFMLTGTVRNPPTDRKHFNSMLAAFTKRFKKTFPTIPYVIVVERHKSGGLHWHMACYAHKGYINYNRVRRIWWASITGNPLMTTYEKDSTPGNIVGSPPYKGRVWLPAKLSRYIGKYLAKDIADRSTNEFNKKRYWASKNIPKPVMCRFFIPRTVPVREFLRDFVEYTSGRRVRKLFHMTGELPGLIASTY